MAALWHYLASNRPQVQGWAVTTIWLTAVPLAAGLALALPAGWAASRFRWSYPPLVSLAGVLYTIPSLVLFLVLPGILGTRILDTVNVAVALTIYTFALLVRAVADGLSAVPADTLAAASAMGYTDRQRLLRVQLPLAVPVIGAGLRVAAVSGLSLVAVASIIGTAQLGQLFITGSNLGILTPIVLGLICFVILALCFDLLILLAIRALAPWRRAVPT
jgi:osmoprotectant transport system permease protein